MHPTRNLRAAIAMLCAVGLFALMDSILKLLSPHYPPIQMAALRGAASLPLVLVWALATVGAGGLLRVRWSLHLLRGALAVAMIACFSFGLRSLPLSTAYTLFFIAPMLITALSVPLLGEHVGPRRWAAIVVGMIGVLVVLRPTGEGMFTLAGLAVLGAAAAYAVSAVAVRILGRSDSTQAMVFWTLAIMALAAGLASAPVWVAIAPEHWLLLAALGLTGALGQYAVTEAFRVGEASVVAPLEYTALVWALGLDLLIWQVLPDTATLLGAAIIIASGIYLLHREQVRRRQGSA
jgi:drug/metabolite transporter (DMT)-like permease